MRIAIIHYSAPPVIGGVERIVAEQARALSQLGHAVTVICGNVDARIDGVTVVQAQELNSQSSASLESLLAAQDAVLVHNVFTMPFNLKATRALRTLADRFTQIRWINWVHDVAAINPAYRHLPWDSPDLQQLRHPVPHCLNVAVSEHRRREYDELLRVPSAACQVIPNGVEVSKILHLSTRVSALIPKLQLWERDFVLLHPARLLRRKNIEFTLRVTHALRHLGFNAVCLITGAPDPHNADGMAYAAELEALARELDLMEAAHFLGKEGALTDDDVRGLYTLSDTLLFPSQSEGFGLPVVEAALHGLPVFCSDIPAHRELSQAVSLFFSLDSPPEHIACEISRHPRVSDRRNRRLEIAARLDWSYICTHHVLPLLGAAH